MAPRVIQQFADLPEPDDERQTAVIRSLSSRDERVLHAQLFGGQIPDPDDVTTPWPHESEPFGTVATIDNGLKLTEEETEHLRRFEDFKRKLLLEKTVLERHYGATGDDSLFLDQRVVGAVNAERRDFKMDPLVPDLAGLSADDLQAQIPREEIESQLREAGVPEEALKQPYHVLAHARFRLRKINNFLRIMEDRDLTAERAKQTETLLSQQLQQDPEVEGGFFGRLLLSYSTSMLGALQAGQAIDKRLGGTVPPDGSATLSLQALGLMDPPQDLVDAFYVAELREKYVKDYPRFVEWMNKGIKWQDDHNWVSNIGVEILAWLPIAVLEGPAAVATAGGLTRAAGAVTRGALGGAKTRISANLAVNAGLNAAEAAIITPSESLRTRVFAAGIAGLGAGVLEGGGRALGAGAKAGARKLFNRGARTDADIAMARTQLAKILRVKSDLISNLNDETATRLADSISDGLVDGTTISQKLRDGQSTEQIASYLDEIAKGIERESEKVNPGDVPKLFGDGGVSFRARAAADAAVERERLWARYSTGGASREEGRRIAMELVDLYGVPFDDPAILGLGRGAESTDFYRGLDRYVERVSTDTANKVRRRFAAIKRTRPAIPDEDLDYFATKIFKFEFQHKLRGIDASVDLRVLDEVPVVADIMRRAHGVKAASETPRAAGRVKVEVEAGRTTLKPLADEAGRDLGQIQDFARPAVRIAMDLFASEAPGFHAIEGVHELAHAYLHSMSVLNPGRYERLAQEVVGIYSKNLPNTDLPNVQDPVMIAELFARLMQNHTLSVDTFRGGDTFIEVVERKFRDTATALINKVREWRAQFWNASDSNGNPIGRLQDKYDEGHSFPKMWSQELSDVANRFARGEWADLADELAAIRRPIDGQGSTPGTTPQFFHEALEEGVPKVANGKPKPPTRLVDFKGLSKVPARADVSPNLMTSASMIDYVRVARAMLSDALVDQVDGSNPVPVWQRVRQMAGWYEASNKAGPYIKTRLVELAKKYDPLNVSRYESLSPRRVMNLLGALGASRSPDQNLRLAIQGLAYQMRIPGGADPRTMTREEAARITAVNTLGEYALAPATEVLKILALSGAKNARSILARGSSHRDFPRAGESLLTWLDREPVGMSDALKLPAYNVGLTLDDQGVRIANDVWQQRFFLNNDPERLDAIYALSDGDVQRFMASRDTAKARIAAFKQKSKELEDQVRALQKEAKGKLSKGRRQSINDEIERLRAEQLSYGTRGARIARTNGDGFRPYNIKAADYRLMDNLQLSLAEMLNRADPRRDNFWHGKRVQAAIWGLMRGDGLSDARKVDDFLQVATREFEEPGGRFERWFEQAVKNATADADQVTVRSSLAINTPFGRNEMNNKLVRHMQERRSAGKKFGVNEQAQMFASLNTVNGQAPVRLAKSVGASNMRHRPATGMFMGDIERTAEMEFQAAPGQVKSIGHFTAALNRQRAWEGVSLRDDLERLPDSVEGFRSANGVVIAYRNAGTQEAAEAAFERFMTAISRATGRPVREIVEGGTTTVRGGVGMTRITAGRLEDGSTFGIVDEDAFLRYIFDAEEAADAEVGLWKGESWYNDVVDELDEGLVGGQWDEAWRRTSGALRGSEPRDVDALPFGAGEAADVVSARHLFHALKDLPLDARRDIARDYLVQTRARFRLAASLAEDFAARQKSFTSRVNKLRARIGRAKTQNAKDKLRAELEELQASDPAVRLADSAITPDDLKAFQPTADGAALRLLSDIEPEVLPESVVKEVISSAKSLKKVAFRGLDARDRQLLVAQQREAKRLGVEEPFLPKEFYDVLDPRDAAKRAQDAAQQSADSFRAAGDEGTARVRDATARNAMDALRTAQYADPSASPVEVSLAQQATGGQSRELVRETISVLRHGARNLFRNRFERVNEVDAEVSNYFNLALNAGVEAKVLVDRLVKHVTKDLSEEELGLFERFLQTEKAKVAIARAGGDRDKVSPHLVSMMLSPVEERTVRDSARIQEAIRRHKTKAQPEIERILIGIDPANAGRLMETESGAFVSSLRFNPELHGPDVRTFTSTPGAGVSLPGKFNLPSNSPSMKTFRGTAEKYVTDYGEIMRWRFNRELSIYRQRQLVNLMAEKGLIIPRIPGAPRPTKLVGGKPIKWEPIQIRRAPEWIRTADLEDLDRPSHELGDKVSIREYWAPDPIRRAWEDLRQGGAQTLRFARGPDGQKLLGSDKLASAWFGFADLTTAATLATIAEATRHSLRVLALSASIPDPPRLSTRALPGGGAARVLTPQFKATAARMLLPWVGPRAMRLRQMAHAYNLPEADDLIQWAGRVGGIPDRAFSETHLSEITRKQGAVGFGVVGGAVGGSVGGLPGAAVGGALGAAVGRTKFARRKFPDLVHRGREFLFSMPEADARTFAQMWKDGDLLKKKKVAGVNLPVGLANFRAGPLGFPVPRSLWGFDVRARVVATKIFFENLKVAGRIPEDIDLRRFAQEPTPFDTELREFLLAFGQYSNKTQTRMVEFLRNTRLNPFAASQGGIRPAEIERLFGVSRLPTTGLSREMRGWYMLQTISGGWLGYMTALAVANKALAGHWPWQNQEGRELDLDLGVRDADGSPTYIQGNFLEPTSARGLRTIGARTMLDERAGRTAGERALSVLDPNLQNEFFQLVAGGPPVQIAQIATRGKLVTFKSQTGEDLRVSPPAAQPQDELKNRLLAAFASMNANVGQFMSEELATKRHAQDPRLVWAFEVPHVIFGHVGRLGRPPTIEAGGLSRIERRKRSDVAWFNVQRYQSTADPAKKQEVFREYMHQFRTPRERLLARRDFFRILRSTKKSPIRRAIESERIRREQRAP